MTDEFENERIPGLPGDLPAGERILWRGSPQWQALSWRAFHVRDALAWFALVGVARCVADLASGMPLTGALAHAGALLPVCALGCAVLATLAWVHARTTIYTVTDKRVVMRIGIALPITVNIPHAQIAGAFARFDANGAGDVGLSLGEGTRLAWLVLWPHARPWHVRSPQPLMRAIPDGAGLANILSDALAGAARAQNDACVRTEIAIDARGHAPVAPTPDGLGAAT